MDQQNRVRKVRSGQKNAMTPIKEKLMCQHPIYEFYIVLEDGSIEKAKDVKDALLRGKPDYYGICSENAVTSVGRTVLSTLIQGINITQAGNDIQEVLTHYSTCGNEYEEDVKFYLYPITKKLYLHALHTGSYAPFSMGTTQRAEFNQKMFLEWIINYYQPCTFSPFHTREKIFKEFQSILPMLFLAWHQNQPSPSLLMEHPQDVCKTANGNIVASYAPDNSI